jgi:hypothetical protein
MSESSSPRDDQEADLEFEAGDAAPAPVASDSSEHWRELLTQVGSEIAVPLSAALERVTALATTGRIDRQNLRALRDEVEAARRAGMVGQQLARFASGRVRQSHERLQLTQLLRDVLLQRGRELQARGVEVRPVLKSAEVIADPSLLFSLLHALLDWCAEHARSGVDLRLDHKTWPLQARLVCRFNCRPAGDLPADGSLTSLDTLSWRLVQQSGWTMGVIVERQDSESEAVATLQFPRTVNREFEGVSAIELDQGHFGPSSMNSKPLAGSHVLVLSPRRDLRQQVRQAIAHMGLVVDFVNAVDEAREFCQGGLPHALVYEATLAGPPLDQLRDEIRAEVPEFPFIEVVDEGEVFEVSNLGAGTVARVGRDGLQQSLPSALIFELSKGL